MPRMNAGGMSELMLLLNGNPLLSRLAVIHRDGGGETERRYFPALFCMSVMCFKAVFFFFLSSFFSRRFNSYLKLAYVSKRGLCVVTFSSPLPRLPTARHALVFKGGLRASGHKLCAARLCRRRRAPAGKCDQSAPLGARTGALSRNLQGVGRSITALDGLFASERWVI